VPPQYHEQAGLGPYYLFGGFLRPGGDDLVYGPSQPDEPRLRAFAGDVGGPILQMIPFFGPFVSWSPPVLVAVFTKPEVILPTLLVMGIGWFLVMNVLQPRLMQHAIGRTRSSWRRSSSARRSWDRG
jgi:hypothetical protein